MSYVSKLALEYCVQAWCPWLEKDKQALEKGPEKSSTKLVQC